MFKKEEGLTYIAMIFIIIFIALIVFGAIYQGSSHPVILLTALRK